MEAHGLPILPPARYPRCVQVQTFTYKCITKMPEYANKSLEELRYEDYVKGGRLASVICSVSGVLVSELSKAVVQPRAPYNTRARARTHTHAHAHARTHARHGAAQTHYVHRRPAYRPWSTHIAGATVD